jgi:PAS domain S-box-containing protein
MTGGHDAIPGGGTSSGRDPTIRSRVITLVGIILAPFIAMMTWLATDYASIQRSVIEIERVSVADTLSHLLDRDVAAIQGALQGLGSSEDLAMGDFERFGRHAEHIVRQNAFTAIRVFTPSGDIAFSTSPQTSDAVSARARGEIINKVFRGQSLVSSLQTDPNNGLHTFSVTIPVPKNGQFIYALSADVRHQRLESIFKEAGLKTSWIAAIVDRSGNFVARSLSPEQFIGRQARPELVAVAADSRARGEFTNVTHEGTPTANSFQKSALTGWTAVVAVPIEILNAPYRRSMSLVLFGTAAITFLSLAAAAVMAAKISEPIRKLRNISTAIIEGRTPPETSLQIAELNEVRAALDASVEKKEHLAAIVASSGDAIMSVGLDGRIRTWNTGAEKLFGYAPEDVIGKSKALVVPSHRREELAKHIDIISSGQSTRVETVRMTRDGTLLDVSLDMAPIRNSTGRIIAMSSIIHDITSRKSAEKHQRFLMRELTHRSKNLLAIVQSMARQTARSSTNMEDFEKRYMQRLQGLAASHDLLVNQNWVGAPLNELVRRQVDAFAEANRLNVAISGPDIVISAKAAQTIGLALHELATNSMKYGALSTPTGKVSIEWVYIGSAEDTQKLQIIWQEHAGPIVKPPTRKGFGHFVIERMATQSLNATVTIDFKPEGLIWTLTAALKDLQHEAEFEGDDVGG